MDVGFGIYVVYSVVNEIGERIYLVHNTHAHDSIIAMKKCEKKPQR